MSKIELFNEDCYEVVKRLEDNSVDAIVSDPPYDINFMNKGWDKQSLITNKDFWGECLRVLKPGGHLLAFGHSRTSHRTATAIEDAGFEIRDTIMWIYGSGFPKSHNVAIGIDKQAKAMGHRGVRSSFNGQRNQDGEDIPAAVGVERHKPITDEAKRWDGWGSALKPAHEPVIMARKPLEGTIAQNVLQYGTGAINIDATRYGTETITINKLEEWSGFGQKEKPDYTSSTVVGRHPANVIFDEDAAKELDETNKITKGSGKPTITDAGIGNGIKGQYDGRKKMPKAKEGLKMVRNVGDSGGVSRYFYCAKVSKKERNATGKNNHPTVKPIELMKYLIKMVSREGHTVLDPFMGSGSTGIAAKLLGRNFIGCEKEKEYYDIAHSRIENWKGEE